MIGRSEALLGLLFIYILFPFFQENKCLFLINFLLLLTLLLVLSVLAILMYMKGLPEFRIPLLRSLKRYDGGSAFTKSQHINITKAWDDVQRKVLSDQ